MGKMANVARRWVLPCLMAGVLVPVLAGCASGRSTGAEPSAQRLRVGAEPFALAEVARRVGLGRVVVADHGDVVLTTGGDEDPWLDPVAMERVTQRAGVTLSGADPAGRPVYQRAARAYQAQLVALDIDYRSSLADCALHDVVTADDALAPLAVRYGFTAHPVADQDAAALATLVEGKGIPVVFTEVGVPAGPVEALARATGARVGQLDTTTVRTPEEVAQGASYLSLMTDNLAKLRTALECTSAP